MYNSRPSPREIYNKVRDALAAVKNGNSIQALTKHISGDYAAMGVDDEAAFWALLEQLLEEILDAGPGPHYVGGRPPQRSYECQLNRMELWAYAWDSILLGKTMYLKFCLIDNYYYHVDCHESIKS